MYHKFLASSIATRPSCQVRMAGLGLEGLGLDGYVVPSLR